MQPADPWRDAPCRPVRLGPVECEVERRVDGSILMRLAEPLRAYPRRYTDRLVHWARVTPDQVFMGWRPRGGPDAGAWDTVSYAQTLERARAIGQALLDRDLGPERPVVILSENEVDNQLLALACLHVGVPCVPVSPAYSLLSTDHARLRHLNRCVHPGLVYAASGAAYAEAARSAFPQAEFVASRDLEATGATPLAALVAAVPGAAVDAAHEAIVPDDVAKILFTSGTTGDPKGVIQSHRMLCSNRQQVVQAMPFNLDAPPVLVDWLPWHHTFGGTNNVGLALYCGGSYYIDPGRPTPEAMQRSVDALREISPTIYCNTPAGLAALVAHLRDDEALRARFFARLHLIYYGGAVLPAHTWAGLDEAAVRQTGRRVLVVSGIGSTECGPVPMTTSWDPGREAVAGLPLAGVDVKLVPVDDRLELRLRGDCVTPGYWREPALTRDAFDSEGFFRLGDAVTCIDPDHPERGLRFDGRLADNFKLASGTWVRAGAVRSALLAAFAPLAFDAVIAGEGREIVGALVFPDLAACRALDAGLPGSAGAAAVLASPCVRAAFQERLDALAAAGTGGSNRVMRVALEAEAPSLDSGEVTAKSTVSAAAVLRRRTASIEALFAQPPADGVLLARRS